MLSPGFRRLGLAALVFVEQHARVFDIGLLPLLGPAHEEDDQFIPVLGEMEPISRPPVDPVFAKPAADLLDVRQIAQVQPDDGRRLFGRGRSLNIEIVEPTPERAKTVFPNIFLNNHIALSLVTYALP